MISRLECPTHSSSTAATSNIQEMGGSPCQAPLAPLWERAEIRPTNIQRDTPESYPAKQTKSVLSPLRDDEVLGLTTEL